MHRVISVLIVFAFLFSSLPLFAEENEKLRNKYIGIQIDVGAPNGAGLSLIVRPVNWAHLNFGATYNAMAPGMFAGLTLDPIKFGIAPTLTAEAGGSFRGRLSFISDAPDISYRYVNIWPGLEFGNQDSWRFFLRGGVSWIGGTVHDFGGLTKNKDNTLSFSDPKISVFVAPTVKFGFLIYF